MCVGGEGEMAGVHFCGFFASAVVVLDSIAMTICTAVIGRKTQRLLRFEEIGKL